MLCIPISVPNPYSRNNNDFFHLFEQTWLIKSLKAHQKWMPVCLELHSWWIGPCLLGSLLLHLQWHNADTREPGFSRSSEPLSSLRLHKHVDEHSSGPSADSSKWWSPQNTKLWSSFRKTPHFSIKFEIVVDVLQTGHIDPENSLG